MSAPLLAAALWLCAGRASAQDAPQPKRKKHPKLMGAVVKSDEWTVKRGKDGSDREFFNGNVSYKHDGDVTTAGRAVYDKKAGVFRAFEDVYSKRYLEPRGFAELWSDRQSYDFERQQAAAEMDGGGLVRLRWTDPGQPEGSAAARRLRWREAEQEAELEGSVTVHGSSRAAAGEDIFDAAAEEGAYNLSSRAGHARGGADGIARVHRAWADGRDFKAAGRTLRWSAGFDAMDMEGSASVWSSSPSLVSPRPDTLEASADKAHYDAGAKKGWARADGAEPVRAHRRWGDGRDLRASARSAWWDAAADVVRLEAGPEPERVDVAYLGADGQLMKARSRRATMDGRAKTALLEAGVRLTGSSETARAEWADFNDETRELRLKNGPPIVEFKDPGYEGAIQADRVRTLGKEQRLEAHGQAHGWIHYEEKAKDGAQGRKSS